MSPLFDPSNGEALSGVSPIWMRYNSWPNSLRTASGSSIIALFAAGCQSTGFTVILIAQLCHKKHIQSTGRFNDVPAVLTTRLRDVIEGNEGLAAVPVREAGAVRARVAGRW